MILIFLGCGYAVKVLVLSGLDRHSYAVISDTVSFFAVFTMDLIILAWALCSIIYLGLNLLHLCIEICRYHILFFFCSFFFQFILFFYFSLLKQNFPAKLHFISFNLLSCFYVAVVNVSWIGRKI